MLFVARIVAAGFCAGVCLFAQESIAQVRLSPDAQMKMMAEGQMGIVATRVLSAEFGVEGKTVKGAPYSAQAVTEITQTLADGNRFYNKTTSFVARDSAGRTRREQSFKILGAGPADQPPSIVFINDPDAQASYVLEPATHTARRTPLGHPEPVSIAQASTLEKQKLVDEQASLTKESLGSKMIEGVNADGVRVTHTIPAGQIGNEKPIQMVSETWTSPDLQVIVMSKRSDPRMGDTTYTLTNIQRAEPDPALFAVPADYNITESNIPATTNKSQFFYIQKAIQ